MLSASELASITTTVAAALDVSLPLSRPTRSNDGYGHTTESLVSQGNIACNIIKPTATQLQVFAGLIGSQRALIIRVMQATDVRENDQCVYDGLTWRVQTILDAESYTVTKEYLMTVVA